MEHTINYKNKEITFVITKEKNGIYLIKGDKKYISKGHRTYNEKGVLEVFYDVFGLVDGEYYKISNGKVRSFVDENTLSSMSGEDSYKLELNTISQNIFGIDFLGFNKYDSFNIMQPIDFETVTLSNNVKIEIIEGDSDEVFYTLTDLDNDIINWIEYKEEGFNLSDGEYILSVKNGVIGYPVTKKVNISSIEI
jgi:hypothetical protein